MYLEFSQVIIICLGCVAMAVFLFIKSEKDLIMCFFKCKEEVVGKLVDLDFGHVPIIKPRGGVGISYEPVYYPVYEFEVDGMKRREYGLCNIKSDITEIGREYVIRYNRDNPSLVYSPVLNKVRPISLLGPIFFGVMIIMFIVQAIFDYIF